MSNKNSLTLAKIDGDGHGNNLSEGYTEGSEITIRHKTDQYNQLAGQTNNPDKFIRQYRTSRLGVTRSTALEIRRVLAGWLFTLARVSHKAARKVAHNPYYPPEA